MSDKNQSIKRGLCKPLYWLYQKTGEEVQVENVFQQGNVKPMSSCITSFSYKYDEENDDECVIDFMFESITQMDNEIFQEDVVLLVQWGYIEPGGNIVKSPMRTIAVREIKTSYASLGIKLVTSV